MNHKRVNGSKQNPPQQGPRTVGLENEAVRILKQNHRIIGPSVNSHVRLVTVTALTDAAMTCTQVANDNERIAAATVLMAGELAVLSAEEQASIREVWRTACLVCAAAISGKE